jgi:hypothetical protein
MEDKYKVTGNFYSVNTRNSKEKSEYYLFDEEDLVDDTKESGKMVEETVEIQEPEKEEKTKKEKPQKEKIKKEKVKKEKPQKAPKTFGKKKKKIEDDEPLKIVSLADLRNKKDSD